MPTVQSFMNSDKFLRYLQGPFGSGKSVGCVQELVKRAAMQAPDEGGVRRTRFAVIRNTYRQLQDTTMKTFLDWYPDRVWGTLKVADAEYHMRFQLPDETIVECEVLFRALDRPDQVGNLLSLELTGAWCNEMREMPLQIWDALQGRVGRYPNSDDVKCTWWGIWGDSNPPDTDHWIYKLFEEERPDNAAAFYQPSGLSDEAENVANLPPRYYENMKKGKDNDYITVYVEGKYGFVREGKPVYPEYNDEVHCREVEYDPRFPVYRGWDFGRTPCCVFAQLVGGRLHVFDELTSEGTGIENFAKEVIAKTSQMGNVTIAGDFGDPSGGYGSQVDEQTVYSKLWELGINIEDGVQDLDVRLSAVKTQLTTMVNGHPAMIISPAAKVLRKGFIGGYCYKRMQISGERYADKPDKSSFYSHIHDGLQYLCTRLFGSYAGFEDANIRVVGGGTRGY